MMSDEQQKWVSPHGHPVASDVTDKIGTSDFLTRGQTRMLAPDGGALDDLQQIIYRENDSPLCLSEFLALKRIRAALTAKQSVDEKVKELTILYNTALENYERERRLRLKQQKQSVNAQLVEALKKLWELHQDATGKKPRTSKIDIEDYYANVERLVKKALAAAEKAGE